VSLGRKLGVTDELRSALRRVRRIAAGPGPKVALELLGLEPDLAAGGVGSEAVIEVLRRQGLAGRHVGLQLGGESPDRQLVFFLESEGAHVHGVTLSPGE
jgi:uroporphyrinogen-III synthase